MNDRCESPSSPPTTPPPSPDVSVDACHRLSRSKLQSPRVACCQTLPLTQQKAGSSSDLGLFAASSSMRLCWMADAVGRICFLFGLGCIGPVVFVVPVVDAVGSLSSPPVNGDRTELFAVIWTSTVGASRRGVLCFASRASR